MKLVCQQETLAKWLSIVSRAVPSKSTLPVLSNILLATEDGQLKLAATNLEVAITTWLSAKIEDEGAITVPARLLTEFVNSLPPDRIEMELSERTRTLHLLCARAEANIKGIDAEEFPPIPRVSDRPTTEIDAQLLREAVQYVAFAAAQDDIRPVLTGVLLSFQDNTLTAAAADGFRLAVKKVDLASPVEGKVDVIVPARTLSELARILDDDEAKVEVTITPNKSQIMFHMANVNLVSKLVEGNFPNYQQIIPQRPGATRVMVNAGEFLRATKRASFFARESANAVKLGVTPGDDLGPGRLTVTATAAEVGDNHTELDAIVEGNAAQISFNAKYLSDVLGVLGSGQIALEVASPSSPGVIRPTASDDYTHVIMPMHLAR